MSAPAPETEEIKAAAIHLDAARMRGCADALLDSIGLDRTLGEIELLKSHVVERAHRRGIAKGWSR